MARTLRALEEYLKNDYIVLSLDFQQLGTEDFSDASTFVRAFARVVLEALTSEVFSKGESGRIGFIIATTATLPSDGCLYNLQIT